MQRVLITGGSGFIGFQLTQYLCNSKQYELGWISRQAPLDPCVHWLKIDEGLPSEIANFKPDCVIHMAASFDNRDIEKLLECNVRLPVLIMQALIQLPELNRNFIFIGSYWQLGDKSLPGVAIDNYSASKLSLRAFVDHYAAYQKINAIELLVYGTYGRQDRRLKILELLLDSLVSHVHLDMTLGQQQLNLVHVEDVCLAIQLAIEYIQRPTVHPVNERYRISGADQLSLIELISLIEEKSGKKLNVTLGAKPYRKVEVFEPIHRDPLLPGWENHHRLEDYIQDYLNDIEL